MSWLGLILVLWIVRDLLLDSKIEKLYMVLYTRYNISLKLNASYMLLDK